MKTMFVVVTQTHIHPTRGSKWGQRHAWPRQKGTVTCVISIFDLPHYFAEKYMCVCAPLSGLDLPLSPALIEADTWEGPVYDSPQPVHIKSCSLKVRKHQHHLSTSRLDARSLHRPSTDSLQLKIAVSVIAEVKVFPIKTLICVRVPLQEKPAFFHWQTAPPVWQWKCHHISINNWYFLFFFFKSLQSFPPKAYQAHLKKDCTSRYSQFFTLQCWRGAAGSMVERNIYHSAALHLNP